MEVSSNICPLRDAPLSRPFSASGWVPKIKTQNLKKMGFFPNLYQRKLRYGDIKFDFTRKVTLKVLSRQIFFRRQSKRMNEAINHMNNERILHPIKEFHSSTLGGTNIAKQNSSVQLACVYLSLRHLTVMNETEDGVIYLLSRKDQ